MKMKPEKLKLDLPNDEDLKNFDAVTKAMEPNYNYERALTTLEQVMRMRAAVNRLYVTHSTNYRQRQDMFRWNKDEWKGDLQAGLSLLRMCQSFCNTLLKICEKRDEVDKQLKEFEQLKNNK